MIRLTRKVFTDLSIWMIGLGFFMGVIFPFFVAWMGIPPEMVITPWFFLACIAAGIIVGGLNISLARAVVGSRIKTLGERMHHVTQNFISIKKGKDIRTCDADECLITVDSEDEIGYSAEAFNTLVETLFESFETEDALNRFSRLLSSQMAVADLTENALVQLMATTQSAAGAVVIEKEGELIITASQGIRDVDTILSSAHVKSVLRNEKRVSLVLPEDVQVEGVLTDFRPYEVLIEPILYKQVVLGLIILASSNSYSLGALNRLTLFVQSLALALHNSLLFERLERLAALDPLTGIYNRRFGMTRLREEFGRTLRINAPLGILMIDIDHFKQVNDTYGHLVGDRILIRLAKIVRSVLREGDILVRYGGEEFIAILPGASRNDVLNVATRLNRKVVETVVTDGDEEIKVTVSVGGVSYPENDVANEMDLIDKADQALYLAKESGRNCVQLAGVR